MSANSRSSLNERFAGRGPLLIALGAVVGGLILLCIFGVLLLQDEEQGGLTTATPTLPALVATVPAGEVLVVGIGDSGPISLTLDSPVRLDVTGQSFTIQSQTVSTSGVWTPAIVNEGTAVWVYGTVINYIFGLLDTADNRALMEQLTPGDEITIVGASGNERTFLFSSREITAATDQDIYAQNMPGVTLVLFGTTGGDRLVVHGRYVVANTPIDSSPTINEVALGETAQLDSLQITATGTNFLFDRPEAPPGFNFFLVNYQAQNVGQNPFDSTLLELLLADDLGNRYVPNPLAGQLGNFPPISGSVAAGQTITATVGYQIPAGLSSATLRWQVRRTDTGSQFEVVIPFNTGRDALQINVALQDAQVSEDGTTLFLGGQITNLGEQPLIVRDTDLSLTSEGTTYLLSATNPGFPWSVGPGQTIPFTLAYQRPQGASAVFTLLNQPFELTGLR